MSGEAKAYTSISEMPFKVFAKRQAKVMWPFAVGFGLSFYLVAFKTQMSLTDEDKADSKYLHRNKSDH